MKAEKRFYQLELVNREQNYNKIFNANPIIGVLDPLQAKVFIYKCYMLKVNAMFL